MRDVKKSWEEGRTDAFEKPSHMLETMAGRAWDAMKGVQDFCWWVDSILEKLSEINKRKV